MDYEEIDEFRVRFKISAPAEAVGKVIAIAVAEILKLPGVQDMAQQALSSAVEKHVLKQLEARRE